MTTPIEASFTWTSDDFDALCDAYARLTPGRRRARIIHFVLDGLLLAATVVYAAIGERLLAAYFASLLIFLLLLEFVVKPWQRRRQFRNQHLGEEEIRITADDDGVVVSSTLTQGRQMWKAFRHVDDTDRHIILWPNNRIGFLIPKRAFSSPEDALAFAALAKEKTRGQTL